MIKIFEKFIQKWEIPEKLLQYQNQEQIRVYGFEGISNWKTKIILCNSPNSDKGDKVGNWDEVGYVGVSYDDHDNLIVPIARADEHQNGYELLGYFFRKGILPHDKFRTIFTSGHYNYVYYNEDHELCAKAYKRFLEYGGKNSSLLVRWRAEDGRTQEADIDLKTFVKVNGNISKLKLLLKEEGVLSPDGKEFIDFLFYLSLKLKDYRNPKPEEYYKDRWNKATTTQDIANFIHKEIKILDKIKFMNALYYEIQLKRAANKFDVDKIEELVFTHDGLKNTIHMMLRKKDKKLKPFFGNLELAEQRLSQIT